MTTLGILLCCLLIFVATALQHRPRAVPVVCAAITVVLIVVDWMLR